MRLISNAFSKVICKVRSLHNKNSINTMVIRLLFEAFRIEHSISFMT